MTTPTCEERTRAILEERARLLARPAAATPDSSTMTVMSFVVAERTCAIEVGHIRGLLAGAEISRLPWSPPAVAGVMNLRGEIVVVADVARLLGIGNIPSGSPVIVIGEGDRLLGLQVDTIGDLQSVSEDLVVPTTAPAPGSSAELVLGMTRSMTILDGPSLLTHPRLTSTPQESR